MLKRTPSSITIGTLTLASLTVLAVSAAAQMTLSSSGNNPFANRETLKPNRQVVSLVPPPNQTRQVVDLRVENGQPTNNRHLPAVPSSPFETRADLPSWSQTPADSDAPLDRLALVSSGQESGSQRDKSLIPQPGSDAWVDAVIPKQIFDEANVTPRGAESLQAHPDLPTVPTDPQSLGRLPPDIDSKTNINPQADVSPQREQGHLDAAQGFSGQEGSAHGPANHAPFAPQNLRVPGQTYTPQQAIPNSLFQDAGQQPPSQEPGRSGAEALPPMKSPAENLPAEKSPAEKSPAEKSPAENLPNRTGTQPDGPGLEEVEAIPVVPSRPFSDTSALVLDPSVPTTLGSGDNSDSGESSSDDSSTSGMNERSSVAGKGAKEPLLQFTPHEYFPARIDAFAQKTEYQPGDFMEEGGPQGSTFDPQAAAAVYRGKFNVPTQRPLIELWRPLYTAGIYPPAPLWFGATNPMKPHFLVYGDMRTVVGANRNAAGKQNIWGNVLNLDMDLQLTSTERIHMFISPLNKATTATGLNLSDFEVIDGVNVDPVTLFFEGDVGALVAGARNQFSQFDLPFTFGLIPLIYQNGIWANDAVLGAAMALPARHNRFLKWSNYDASLFWATDKITTDAFPGQDSASDMFGTAWFIDAYEGYIEADYAYVADNVGGGRSYHNLAFAFTRRYFAKVSNSVRFIVNMGQDNLANVDRTADGHLLLIENSLITAYPNTFVPYFNLFYGQGRPQSLARAGLAGGILTNTGINFETDGITNYPTLDPTGHNTFGFATGVNMLGAQFSHQLILEFAMLKTTGPAQLRNAEGDQYAVGLRYQKPLNHRLIFRTDHMVGFREGATNIHGSRFELRWKF